jgi:low affinity Fe/Cu permease
MKTPTRSSRSRMRRVLENASQGATRWAGSASAFSLAVLVLLVWITTGPVFHFSDTWQLVINTGTTIVTFLMVFLIQRAQNKDALAIQLKLNEIVAALGGASNRLIDIEELSEAELRSLKSHFHEIAKLAKYDQDLLQSHSVEEAARRHHRKRRVVEIAPVEPRRDLKNGVS